MPRTGLAYERPSLVSLALIVGFSLAVVVVAGWLVMMILFSNGANTKAADPAAPAAPAADRASDAADVAALAGTSARAEGALPSNATPGAGPPSAAPFAAPSPAGAATAALGGPAPEMNYRGPGDLLNFPPDAENAAPEAVPLPPPRPRRTAAVPVPRPRPSIDGEQAPQQRSLFDIFVGRQP
jgi:hypothetical protein